MMQDSAPLAISYSFACPHWPAALRESHKRCVLDALRERFPGAEVVVYAREHWHTKAGEDFSIHARIGGSEDIAQMALAARVVLPLLAKAREAAEEVSRLKETAIKRLALLSINQTPPRRGPLAKRREA
jgi:hypothetical protein